MELEGCSQFTNLRVLSLHSGIFSSEGEVATFFPPFTNLETLRLDDVDFDKEHEKYTTDLFTPLTCLKKLSTLEVAFIDKPDLLPLISLSPLMLKNLSIICNVEMSDENSPYSNTLPQLLTSLVHLEYISIHNEWRERFNMDMSEVHSNNLLVAQKYPQLKYVSGNDALSFDGGVGRKPLLAHQG